MPLRWQLLWSSSVKDGHVWWETKNTHPYQLIGDKKMSSLACHCSSLAIHTCQTEASQANISVCLCTWSRRQGSWVTTVPLVKVASSAMPACPYTQFLLHLLLRPLLAQNSDSTSNLSGTVSSYVTRDWWGHRNQISSCPVADMVTDKLKSVKTCFQYRKYSDISLHLLTTVLSSWLQASETARLTVSVKAERAKSYLWGKKKLKRK